MGSETKQMVNRAGVEIPRRNCVDLQTPIERAVGGAVQAVESGPAHPRMTDAVLLLAQALDAVADAEEALNPNLSLSTPTPAADGEADVGDGWDDDAVETLSGQHVDAVVVAMLRASPTKRRWKDDDIAEAVHRGALIVRRALRARPLPDDVRAVVASQDAHTLCVVAVRDEIARRKFSGSAFSADEMVSTVLRTLFAHLQRTEG